MIEEGSDVTVVLDRYFVSPDFGLGKSYLPEIDPDLIELTGRAHHLTPPQIVRLELSEGRTALFHEDDALILKGPTS